MFETKFGAARTHSVNPAEQIPPLALHVRSQSEERAGLSDLAPKLGPESQAPGLPGDALGLREITALEMNEAPGERGADAIEGTDGRGPRRRERALVDRDGGRSRPHAELHPQ